MLRGRSSKSCRQALRASQPVSGAHLLAQYGGEAGYPRGVGAPLGFDVREVLSLAGDSARGAKVFRQKSLQCVNCHDAGNAREPAWLGPSLAKIGTKYRTAEEMLETIVAPSAKIAPEYQMLIILTTGGETISGRVLEEDDDKMTLMGADRKIHEIAFEQIDSVNASEVSLMPAELLQSLSAQEAADLVAYLLSLTDSAGP